MYRRRFLDLSLTGVALNAAFGHFAVGAPPFSPPFSRSIEGENLVDWIHRVRGEWDEELYKKMLGAANDFKEGDEIVGVAAASEALRIQSRELLANTTLSQIDELSPERDELFHFIGDAVDAAIQTRIGAMTIGDLKRFLLERSEAEIQAIRQGLSSDVIACVVRLMTNDELVRVGSKVFNPLPGTNLGARGYMGARVQPNSPTDNVDDIRWQLFNAFAFAVGDVLALTNVCIPSVDRDVLALTNVCIPSVDRAVHELRLCLRRLRMLDRGILSCFAAANVLAADVDVDIAVASILLKP